MIYLKNSIKRNLGISVSLLVLAASITACKQKPAATKPEENPNANPATLTVELFDRAKAGQPDLTNNYWTKYI